MAFKNLETSDYVAGQVWGARGADRFLVDQYRGRLDMPATKAAVKELSRRFPQAVAKLIEDKANGPAVIQELQHDVAGLIAISPEGGKIARANAVAPHVEAGNIYLPHPAIAPWVEAFMEELAVFPHGRHDDQVDAMTQALNRLRNSGNTFFVPESQFIVNPFSIPDSWPRVFAMAITAQGVAAVWGARDSNGTLYLYAEHRLPHAEPSENARAIKAGGDWIPGVINLASVKGSMTDKDSIAECYREYGLRLEIATPGEEAGVYQLWQLLTTNKLKVFASLSAFVAEYRIGDEQSPIMQACHALILFGREQMRTKPVKDPDFVAYESYGSLGWMAN
jgi:predicted phage terminase large subunit-like protein